MRSKPIITISVRELVEFVLRSGDLGGGRDFISPTRAQAGARAHQRIQRSRPDGYRAEVAIAEDIDTDRFVLRIQGRMDGLFQKPDGVVIEEIKTIDGPWNAEPHPLHWAQGKLYAALYAQQNHLARIEVQLTYYDLQDGAFTLFRQDWDIWACPYSESLIAAFSFGYCANLWGRG